MNFQITFIFQIIPIFDTECLMSMAINKYKKLGQDHLIVYFFLHNGRKVN
jgi:hypothetical protein